MSAPPPSATPASPAPATRSSLRMALYITLALHAIATVVPLLDVALTDSVTDHVRAAYPEWSSAQVAGDRNAIIAYLAVLGLLNVTGWLWIIRAVSRRTRRATAITIIIALTSASVALLNLDMSGGAYEHVVPTSLAVVGLVPATVGLVTMIMVARRRRG